MAVKSGNSCRFAASARPVSRDFGCIYPWHAICCASVIHPEGALFMRVNANPAITPSLLSTQNKSQPSPASFQAALDSAKETLGDSSQSVTLIKSMERKEETAPVVAHAKTAAEELTEYLRKTPEQHMREAILKEMGLSEESLAALPPEQRATIEKTITDKIKERLLAHNGQTRNQTQAPLPVAVPSQALQSYLTQSAATEKS
jgi:hypothetical protein